MKLNTQLFAVTDQHVILELKLIAINKIDCNYGIGRTELINNENSHAIAHHKHYFSELAMFEGKIQKQDVFTSEEAARSHAQKNVLSEIDSISHRLAILQKIENKLAA